MTTFQPRAEGAQDVHRVVLLDDDRLLALGRAWRQVDVPLEPVTAGDHTLVVGGGDDVRLVGDAGDGGMSGRWSELPARAAQSP